MNTFAVIVHTSMGDLPGYVRDGGVALYGDGTKAYNTQEFSWIVRVFHKLVDSPTEQVPHVLERDGTCVYLAVAHTTWGDIPGRAYNATAWFSHGGCEHTTTKFSFLEFPTWTLVKQDVKLPPPSALFLGDYYPVIVHTHHGDMIGKAKSGVAWFTYDGWDHSCTKFSWIVHGVALKPAKSSSTTTVNRDKLQNLVTSKVTNIPLTILSSTSDITPTTYQGPAPGSVLVKTEPLKVTPLTQVPGRPHQMVKEEILVEHFSDDTIKTTITTILVSQAVVSTQSTGVLRREELWRGDQSPTKFFPRESVELVIVAGEVTVAVQLNHLWAGAVIFRSLRDLATWMNGVLFVRSWVSLSKKFSSFVPGGSTNNIFGITGASAKSELSAVQDTSNSHVGGCWDWVVCYWLGAFVGLEVEWVGSVGVKG
eukprot:TRINITY_DN2338_c0_g1_i4.p1 TRINITY_DN2338_c0_g1~~TRINITY_DN2338_c0_g1_i4.p1  ORF type:complete len:423 (+),score=78.83 TRINITY_DN2338_c0_g1_i4:2201-3469(+)